MRYLSDLRENEHIVGHFFCKQKQSLKGKSGKTYYSLKLQDKTGVMDAKIWELTHDIQNFNEGDFIKIDGLAQLYLNDIQIRIHKARPSREGEYDEADYIPTTRQNIDAMRARIREHVQSIQNPMIKQLCENILLNNPRVANAFIQHSAAKNLHHSFKGGLLEHTLSVTDICVFLAAHYPGAHRDLLISTAMLHDIGKVFELSEMPVNDYTDDGQLLGHIVMGAELITAESARIPGFPAEWLSLLKHSIVAHHGEYEFGSPKLPQTLEAFLLHCADNLDAKAQAIEETLAHDHTPGKWTGYHRMLNRYLRRVSP
jgi:3'-5' exoribonuclease